mmetsp:Transcript_7208/g.10523  ORF Transcript_7208/g.10523 Transcript_7208/m.10523 type:complete len:121 (-) Transcript_7208:1978-2340(-)
MVSSVKKILKSCQDHIAHTKYIGDVLTEHLKAERDQLGLTRTVVVSSPRGRRSPSRQNSARSSSSRPGTARSTNSMLGSPRTADLDDVDGMLLGHDLHAKVQALLSALVVGNCSDSQKNC